MKIKAIRPQKKQRRQPPFNVSLTDFSNKYFLTKLTLETPERQSHTKENPGNMPV